MALSVAFVTDPGDLWRRYAAAIGQERLHAAYGSHWPRPRAANETVVAFYDESHLIGWGSLVYDETERVAWHTHGIFPEFQAQGVTGPISRWLRRHGFTATPCVAVCCKILDTNPRYQEWMRTKNPNPGWVYAGHVALPEGYDVYCFGREYWDRHEAHLPRLTRLGECR